MTIPNIPVLITPDKYSMFASIHFENSNKLFYLANLKVTNEYSYTINKIVENNLITKQTKITYQIVRSADYYFISITDSCEGKFSNYTTNNPSGCGDFLLKPGLTETILTTDYKKNVAETLAEIIGTFALWEVARLISIGSKKLIRKCSSHSYEKDEEDIKQKVFRQRLVSVGNRAENDLRINDGTSNTVVNNTITNNVYTVTE